MTLILPHLLHRLQLDCLIVFSLHFDGDFIQLDLFFLQNLYRYFNYAIYKHFFLDYYLYRHFNQFFLIYNYLYGHLYNLGVFYDDFFLHDDLDWHLHYLLYVDGLLYDYFNGHLNNLFHIHHSLILFY